MAVPEAAMHEDDRPPRSQNDIRAAGNPGPVQAEAIPERKEYTSHGAFGAGVPATHPGHALAAFPPTLGSACPSLRPNGAQECSHGWSAARVLAGGAEPVESGFVSRSCPGGAEEEHDRAVAQSNTYRSSNSISWRRSIRNNSDLKSSFLWCSCCPAMYALTAPSCDLLTVKTL